MLKRIFYLFGIILMFSSCFYDEQQNFDGNNNNNNNRFRTPTEPPPIIRRTEKLPDPKVQAECARARSRNACEGDDDCEEICDDIFTSRKHKKDCYELPRDLVSEFETLIEATEDGDVEDIDADTLKCLLDIDERTFAKAVKKMSRSESEDFLIFAFSDSYLSEVLEDEDDEFNILEQLLYKATGSNSLASQLKDKIDSDKTVVWLAGESNESGWSWLDGYVNEECDSNSLACPGVEGESIGAYCNALLDTKMSDRDLSDFLSDADLFAEEFQEDVEEEYGDEDASFVYDVDVRLDDDEIGDFRDYCRFIVRGCDLEYSFRVNLELDSVSWHDNGNTEFPRWTNADDDVGSAVPNYDSVPFEIHYHSGEIRVSYDNASDGQNAKLSHIVIDDTEYPLTTGRNERVYSVAVSNIRASRDYSICLKSNDGYNPW